jgi:glyoxylase-like metal-dependent hydrolase (beta-lactamase superfamily II)
MRYNAGVLTSAGKSWLIDPGPHPDEIAEAADLAIGLGATLTGIVLTHNHWDHILGPERLPDVPALAHAQFEAALTENLASTLAMVTRWEQRFGYRRREPFASPYLSETLRDEQTVRLGTLGLRIIHVPGHAADQVAIFEPVSGALWAADTLSNYEIPFVSHNLAAYEESLAKLARLDIRLLVPGHGDPTDDPEAITQRIDEDRAYLRELRARVAAVVAAGGSVVQAVDACAAMTFREPGENRGPHRLNVESAYIELGGDASPELVGWAQEGLIDE